MKKLLFMCGVFYFYLQLVVLMMVLKKIALKRNLTRNKQNLRSLKRTKAGKGSSKAIWKTKLALAFCVEDVDRYTLTKNEILTGIYEYKLATGNKNFKLVDFKLVKYDDSIKMLQKVWISIMYHPIKGTLKINRS